MFKLLTWLLMIKLLLTWDIDNSVIIDMVLKLYVMKLLIFNINDIVSNVEVSLTWLLR